MKHYLLMLGSFTAALALGVIVDVPQANAYSRSYRTKQYNYGDTYGGYGMPYYEPSYYGSPYTCHYYGANGACYNYSYRNYDPYYPSYSYHSTNRSYHPYDVRVRVRYDRYDRYDRNDPYRCSSSRSYSNCW